MGRGTIAGGGAAGLYSLALDVGVAERDAAVAKLDERLAVLVEPIAVLEASLAAAEAARDEAREAAHAAIDAYAAAMQADPEGDHTALTDEIEARSAQAMELEGVAAQSRIALQMLEAERAQLERDRTALLAVEVERTVNAWCVDLTENASGAVATVEVPGEPAQVLIAPGGRAPAEADGRLLARGVMSPAQAFWNAAVLPGWQKFKPDYRTGTLTELNTETNRASVELDALTSSAQGLLVNQANTLTDVPVVYMTCNAQAFEVGDRVVVAFGGRDWTAPTVVGFVTNPKPCHPEFVFLPLRTTGVLNWTASGPDEEVHGSLNYVDGGSPIEPGGPPFYGFVTYPDPDFIRPGSSPTGVYFLGSWALAPDALVPSGLMVEPFSNVVYEVLVKARPENSLVGGTPAGRVMAFTKTDPVDYVFDLSSPGGITVERKLWKFDEMPAYRINDLGNLEPVSWTGYVPVVTPITEYSIPYLNIEPPFVTQEMIFSSSSSAEILAFFGGASAMPLVRVTLGGVELDYLVDGFEWRADWFAWVARYRRPI